MSDESMTFAKWTRPYFAEDAEPGGFWTRDGSESPSVVVASSLSAVLETRSVPRRYWLSAKAAAGILRRAQKRGKTLPARLMTALEALASSTSP